MTTQVDSTAEATLTRFSSIRDRLTVAGLLAYIGYGLWVSFHYARWQWHIDGDISAPFYVWSQIRKDGVSVLQDWRWAQDGWLFSLFLPDFLMFALGGTAPYLVMVQGWVFFVLSLLLVFLLTTQVAGRRVAAFVAGTLLFAGPAVIGGMVYLTYPVEHNITLLWGLAGLLCLLRWFRETRPEWLAAGGVALFIGEISDPWLSASLVLPIMLAAGLTALLRRDGRWNALAIILCAGAAFLLCRTRLFGYLWFLPGSDFEFGRPADVLSHAGWVAVHLAAMFNIVPLPQPDNEWMPPVPLQVVNCVLVFSATGWAAWRVWRSRQNVPSDQLLLAICCAASCAGTGVAFALSNIPGTLYTGRMLLNWFFMLPVLVVCALYSGKRAGARFQRGAAGVWSICFVVAGMLGSPARLMALPKDIAYEDTRALIAFLRDHQLNYGYGPYKVHEIIPADWLTGGAIVIRPVATSSTGRIVPRIAQTFPSWYESIDAPPGQKTFFLILAPDDDLCPAPADCKEQAIRTFGPPDTTLTFKDTPIMVWNHPLLTGLPDEALIAAAPVLEPGKTFAFNRGGAGVPLMWRGWGDPEDDITWTNAHESVLLIHLPDDWTGDAVLDIEASSLPVRVGRGPQPVSVEVDGHTLATWNVTPWDRHRYQVTIPADIAARKRIPLVFHIPQASRPSDFEYIYDIRLLGMAVAGVTLHRG